MSRPAPGSTCRLLNKAQGSILDTIRQHARGMRKKIGTESFATKNALPSVPSNESIGFAGGRAASSSLPWRSTSEALKEERRSSGALRLNSNEGR